MYKEIGMLEYIHSVRCEDYTSILTRVLGGLTCIIIVIFMTI